MHDPHPQAGKTVRLKKSAKHFQFPDFGGSEFTIEDWVDRVNGGSWMDVNNIVCFVYVMRAAGNDALFNDEVVYGHRKDGLGSLVHVSEIEGEV